MIPRQRKPIKRTCANCGDRKCRRKFKVVCWTSCGHWIRDVLSLDVVTALGQERGKPPD